MSIYSVCGICICGAVTVLLLKELRRELIPVIIIGIGVTVLVSLLPKIGESVSFIRELAAYADSGYTGVVIRALGIAYLTSVATELCRSCGEPSLVSYIETAGKTEILILSIPLFRELFRMALLT